MNWHCVYLGEADFHGDASEASSPKISVEVNNLQLYGNLMMTRDFVPVNFKRIEVSINCSTKVGLVFQCLVEPKIGVVGPLKAQNIDSCIL